MKKYDRQTSLFSLPYSPTLSVSVAPAGSAVPLCWVNQVQGGRISLLCLSTIRPASLMQSSYLRSSAHSHCQGEAAVNSYPVCRVFQAPSRSCLHLRVYLLLHTSKTCCCGYKTHCTDLFGPFLSGLFTPRWPSSKQTPLKYLSVQAKIS